MTPTRPLPLAVSDVSPDMAEKVLSNEFTPIDGAPEAPLADVEAAGDEEADEVGDDADGDAVVAAGVPEEHAAITNAAVKATVSAFTTD
jgi:hypothetical protein